MGWQLAVSIAVLTLVIVIELHRAAPLVDIRWIVSPEMLHLTATLLIFRLVLSEQSSGAPRMFQVLGVTQDQLVPLFSVIVIASLIGGLACIPFMKPENLPRFHLVALVLIATGAWMDSHSTIDTRPAQMYFSQALIAAAGSLFLAPSMLRGMISALSRGPNYMLSFIVIFLSTQSIGGAIGSGSFTTFITLRQAEHLQVLKEQLQTTSPMTTSGVAMRAAALAPQITDTAQARAQGVSLIATDISNQAYVLAYNDAYFLTFMAAAAALFLLLLHLLRDWLVERSEARSAGRSPPSGQPAPTPHSAARPEPNA